MTDFNKLLASITGSGIGAGLAGGVAGGALVSALGSKSGRKAAKSVVQIGGLAAIGALAWNAYRKYQGNAAEGSRSDATSSRAAPAAWGQLPQARFESLGTGDSDSQGLLVLRTMISAAMADGHLGPEEQSHIFKRLDTLGLSAEERGTLFDELRNPLPCTELASQVSDPVLAIEAYTAAVMTVDSNCSSARDFLSEFATVLKLPEPLVASVHHNVLSQQR